MKRKDSKGRVLRPGEYERRDKRYAFRYKNEKGKAAYIYSWRLIESDPHPKDKPRCECLRELENSILKDLGDGIQTNSKVTLNQRWDEYIANKPKLKQSTATNYKYMYDKYIRDDIGGMPIKTISYSMCNKFFNHLINEIGFKINSVEIVNTILSPVFKIAVRDGLIRLNPMEGVMTELKKNNSGVETRHVLLMDHQLALMDFVRTHPTYGHWYPLLVCLLGTGCRIGEMLGLRWQDVYWKQNIISINHSLIYRLQDDGSVKFRITTTKTKNSNREIPMFKSVKEVLKAEYERQAKSGFCKAEIEGYSGFIWQNKDGYVLSPHAVNRALERIISAYNDFETGRAAEEKRRPDLLPHFSAHHLRHTFCTRLCEVETDIKVIQEIMGHANITTTMDIYNESNLDRKKKKFEELEKISNAF